MKIEKIIKIGLPTCYPCKQLSKAIHDNYELGDTKFEEVDLSDDEARDLYTGSPFFITGVPSVIVVKDDGSHAQATGFQQCVSLLNGVLG